MQETWVRSLGQEDPLEKEMATHASILAWRIPWTEEPGGLQFMGSERVRHDWVEIQLPTPALCGFRFIHCFWVMWASSHPFLDFNLENSSENENYPLFSLKFLHHHHPPPPPYEVKWSEVAQSCPTLCDPMDYSLPGSSIHGIFQISLLAFALLHSVLKGQICLLLQVFLDSLLLHSSPLCFFFFFLLLSYQWAESDQLLQELPALLFLTAPTAWHLDQILHNMHLFPNSISWFLFICVCFFSSLFL